ncbi:MAG TPA: hypothetical protein VHW93_00715, partial [Acidimicrobiales bacterium]|nr:hypothetical protein [Acidimicrobiales bacterium]
MADQVPTSSPTLTALAPELYEQVVGVPSGPVAPVGYTDEPNLAAARAAFGQQARVRVLFDNGAGDAGTGAMQPVWSQDYTSWPPPQARATTFDLGTGGSLGGRQSAAGAVSFEPDPTARPADDLPSGNVWAAL